MKEEDSQSRMVRQACKIIDDAALEGRRLAWKDISEVSGVSASHLHRVFRKTVGQTPSDYAAQRVRELSTMHEKNIFPVDVNNHTVQPAISAIDVQQETSMRRPCWVQCAGVPASTLETNSVGDDSPDTASSTDVAYTLDNCISEEWHDSGKFDFMVPGILHSNQQFTEYYPFTETSSCANALDLHTSTLSIDLSAYAVSGSADLFLAEDCQFALPTEFTCLCDSYSLNTWPSGDNDYFRLDSSTFPG